MWPTLTPDEVDDLVSVAAVVDEDDVAPSDADWVPTYSIIGCFRAIADGYSMKLAKALPRGFEFTTDGQTFRRQQLMDHLEAQRQMWANKVSATVAAGQV